MKEAITWVLSDLVSAGATDNDHWDSGAEWSPDGSQILFCSMRDDSFELYLMNADGTEERKITTTSVHAIQPAWRQ